MNLLQQFLTNNSCYKAGKYITPKGVMVHSTGVNNPKISRYVPGSSVIGYNQYGNHWDMSGVGACVHAFIGKVSDGSIATVQTLPFNMMGWHCRDDGNNTHISFEICEDDLANEAYFHKVYKEAVDLTAYLCEMYGLDPLEDGVVICHSEGHDRGIASNHADVMHWFPKHGKSMDTFRQDVDKKLRGDVDLTREEVEKICRETTVKVLEELEIARAEQPASPWAASAGVLSRAVAAGISDGSRPRSYTTREEVMAMILAALKG